MSCWAWFSGLRVSLSLWGNTPIQICWRQWLDSTDYCCSGHLKFSFPLLKCSRVELFYEPQTPSPVRKPEKSKSHLLTLPIVWACRLLSVVCHNQRDTHVPPACSGFGSPLIPAPVCLYMSCACLNLNRRRGVVRGGKGEALSEAVHYCLQKSQSQLVGRRGGMIRQYWLIQDEFSLWE